MFKQVFKERIASRRTFLVLMGIMLLCWLPYLLIFFPGTMGYDTYFQLMQCYSEGHPLVIVNDNYTMSRFCDHHPVFDTLFYGAFSVVSERLFGNSTPGLFLLTLLQYIFTAFTYVASLAFARRHGAPRVACLAAFAFICLLPAFPLMAIAVIKDTTFSVLFLLYFLCVLEVCFTKGEVLRNRRFLVVLLVLAVLCSLTKKTGMYQVLIVGVVFMFIYRRYWKQLLASWAVPAVIMMVVMPVVVFPLIDAVPGGKQEALGPLFQQTAAYAVKYGDDTTDEERAAIDAVLGYDDLADRYDPVIHDPVKYKWNFYSTREELMDYLAVWFKQGLRHPDAYAGAVWDCVGGYFMFDAVLAQHFDTAEAGVWGASEDVRPHIVRPGRLAPAREAVMAMFQWIVDAPVLGLLLRIALYTWVIPLVTFIVVLARRRQIAPAWIAPLTCLLACVASSCTGARYAYPLVYLAPLLVCLAASSAPAASADPAEAAESTASSPTLADDSETATKLIQKG